MAGKKRLAINMIAQILSFAINAGVNFWLTPFITRNVGKEIYGFVNLAFQTTGFITIGTTALNVMLARFVTIKLNLKDDKSANIYFSSAALANMVISLILVVPLMCCILNLQKFINIPGAYVSDVKLLWIFIFIAFLSGLMTECFGVSTYAKNRLDLAAKRTVEGSLLKAVILVGAYVLFIPKVWYIGVSILLCGLFVIITNIYYTHKLTPELVISKKYFRWSAVKELVTVGVWNSINQLAQSLISGLDMIITNIYIGAAEMTLMGFSKTVPVYLLSLIGIVSNSFAPGMTITYSQGNMDEFVKEIKFAIKICGFLCSVPVLGFVAFGMKFFTIWLPTLTQKEVLTIQILSIMILLQTIFDVYIYPLYTVNAITCRLKIPVLVNLMIGIGNVVETLFLLKITDLGVYAVQLVSSSLLFLRVFLFAPIYAAHIVNQKWNTFYPPLCRGVLSSGIILLFYFIVASKVKMDSWLSLGASAAVCGLLGYIINYLVVLNTEERSRVADAIHRKISFV